MSQLLTLEEPKAALRLVDEDTDRDDLVEEHIDGVTTIVEDRVGWVTTRDITIEVPGQIAHFVLPGKNVIELTSGEDIATATPVDMTGIRVNSIGVLHRADGGAMPAEPWILTLTVGMDPIPSAIKRGAAEVLIEAWATQRQTPGQGGEIRPFLIPHRAAAWFSGYELGPKTA